MLNLDTHIVVYLLNGTLTPKEKSRIKGEEPAISDIVLWELSKLIQLGRLGMDLDSPEFQEFLAVAIVFPITLEIAVQSTKLDFSSDPADEIIAATSVVNNIPLLTRDARILKSEIVRFA